MQVVILQACADNKAGQYPSNKLDLIKSMFFNTFIRDFNSREMTGNEGQEMGSDVRLRCSVGLEQFTNVKAKGVS